LLSDNRLAWSRRDGTICLWNFWTDETQLLEGHTQYVYRIAELSNGDIISWTSFFFQDESIPPKRGDLRVWDLYTGESDILISNVVSGFRGITEIGEDKIVAWGHNDSIEVIDMRISEISRLEWINRGVNNLERLQCGKLFAHTQDDTVQIWNPDLATSGQPRISFAQDPLELQDGRILTLPNDSSTIYIWDPDFGESEQLDGHTDDVQGAVELDDGRIFSWGADRRFLVWNPKNWEHEVVGEYGKGMNCFTSSENGSREFLVSELLSEFSVIKLKNGSCLIMSCLGKPRLFCPTTNTISVYKGKNIFFRNFEELEDGSLLFWGLSNQLLLWHPLNNTHCFLQDHNGSIHGVIPLSNHRLVSWSKDRTLRLWDLRLCTSHVLKTTDKEFLTVAKLSERELLVCDKSETIWIIDFERNDSRSLKGHTDTVNGALVLGNGQLVSWSEDKAIRVWETESGNSKVLGQHDQPVFCVMPLSENRILSKSARDNFRLWDLDTAKMRELDNTASFSECPLVLNNALLFWNRKGSLIVPLRQNLKPHSYSSKEIYEVSKLNESTALMKHQEGLSLITRTAERSQTENQDTWSFVHWSTRLPLKYRSITAATRHGVILIPKEHEFYHKIVPLNGIKRENLFSDS
jgi:WD40 repeat protein